MRWATFVSHGGCEIELMQPDPSSPLGRRLAKHGEGVHHLCLTTDDPAAVAQRLADDGISVGGEVFEDPTTP
jgi:4-hydroxyphenylpyruvate dioxygenase-like putative hemolysin